MKKTILIILAVLFFSCNDKYDDYVFSVRTDNLKIVSRYSHKDGYIYVSEYRDTITGSRGSQKIISGKFKFFSRQEYTVDSFVELKVK